VPTAASRTSNGFARLLRSLDSKAVNIRGPRAAQAAHSASRRGPPFSSGAEVLQPHSPLTARAFCSYYVLQSRRDFRDKPVRIAGIKMTEDHYAVLGVHRNATAEEIHETYLTLARRYHPDPNPDNPKAVEKFKQVQASFDVLSDPAARARYNGTRISFATLRCAPSRSTTQAGYDAWAFDCKPAYHRRRDEWASYRLFWPAIVMLLSGLLAIPLHIYANDCQRESIRQRIRSGSCSPEESDRLHDELENSQVFVVVQVISSVLAILGALSMFTQRLYPLAVIGGVAMFLCVPGLGIFIAPWAVVTSYEVRYAFRD
jgi:hypothetical protein